MKNEEERGAKKGEGQFGRKCPICLAINPVPPEFKVSATHEAHGGSFLGLGGGSLTDPNDVFPSPQRPAKQKFPPRAKLLLPKVADWLEEALRTFPEINSLGKSDLKTADQLVDLAGRLPDQFREQRGYLLKHKDKLGDTGTDPKWWSTPGRQTRFIAESLAGAEWNLQPSVSREFIRQCKPRRGARPGMDQQWWDPEQGGSAKDED